MAELLDLSVLDKKQKETLTSCLQDVIQKTLEDTDDLDNLRADIDKAIEQEYRNTHYRFTDRLVSNQPNIDPVTARDNEEIEEQVDEFSTLRVPLLYKIFQGWIVHLKSSSFPPDGDWVEISRQHSPFFRRLNLEKFLPGANQAWVNILKTENERFQFEDKYSSAIAEVVSYGNTGIIHSFNPDKQYIDIRTPGIRQMGIHPLTDRWRESSIAVRYDLNYSELRKRKDLDQEFINAIKPSQGIHRDNSPLNKGETRQAYDLDDFVQEGKVRLHDVFIPNLYIEGTDGGPDFEGSNLYFTVAFKAERKGKFEGDEINDGSNDFILKASMIDPREHGILFGSFGTTQPGVFYHKGPLIPFLNDQRQLNQIKSGISRAVAMTVDPPLALRKVEGDFNQTPPDRLEPGAMYEGYDVDTLVPNGLEQAFPEFINFYRYLTEEVEEASGMTRTQIGGRAPSRRTATEIRAQSGGGAIRVQDATMHFDNHILKPSIINRIQLTQLILKNRIDRMLADEGTVNPALETEEDVLNEILTEDPLYQRLKMFSGIEDLYIQFVERTKRDILKDQETLQEIEGDIREIQQLQDFAESPIPPFVPPPEPPPQIDPATGQVIPAEPNDPLQVEQLRQEQEQIAIQEREQALQQVKTLQMQLDLKKLTLTGTQDVPEVSDALLYKILVEPIDDSDVTVTGSKTTLNRDVARTDLDILTGAINNVPEFRQQVDFEKLLALFSKAVNIPLNKIKKSEAKKAQEEEEIKQQQQMAAALQLETGTPPPAPEQPQQ